MPSARLLTGSLTRTQAWNLKACCNLPVKSNLKAADSDPELEWFIHLESWPPGINVYRHVWTMYVQCMYNAIVQQLTDMVYTIIEKHRRVHTCMYIYMYVHLWRCIYMYVHGMYMVCTSSGINVYVHRSDVYVHVYTFMYTFWII